jgi:septal ring factor EnvC (AmiA/AmiB activator)
MGVTRNVLCVLLICFSSAVVAQQPTKEELQRKTQDLMREIEAMRASLQETQKDKKSTLVILRSIEHKIDLRNEIINSIKGEVYYVEKDIIRTYRDIDTLKQELRLLKDQYAQSVVYAYKNRSNYNFLNFLFSASHFSDVLRRISYLKTYRSFREQKAGDITRTQQLLEKKVASLTGKRLEKSKALKEQSKQMSELENEKKDKDKAIAQLKAKENELSASVRKKEKERQKIQNAIAAVIKREKEIAMREARAAEARRKAAQDAANKANASKPDNATASTSPVKTPAPTAPKKTREQSVLENTPEGLIVSQKFEDNKGRMPWPVDRGEIVLHYGNNYIPGKTKSIVMPSDGISIETNVGASVKVIFDGEIASVSNLGDKQLIIVKHGKYFTTYSNLQSVNVNRGQKVNTGQVIGSAGANDEGIGTVDLQMDTERGTINPEQWIRKR